MSTIANAKVTKKYDNVQDDLANSYFELLTEKESAESLDEKEKIATKEKDLKNKLKLRKMDVYTVNTQNSKEVESDMGFTLENLFCVDNEEEVKKIIGSSELTIIVCSDEIEQNPLDVSTVNNAFINLSAALPYDDYDWYFKKVYISAAENSDYTRTAEVDIYEKYTGGSNPALFYDILNRTFNLWIGNLGKSWYVPSALGIDLNDLTPNPNEKFEIIFNGAWTRKFIMAKNGLSGVYRTGAVTEYCNWDQYGNAQYYSISANRLLQKTSHTSGSVFAPNYMNYDWLYAKAKHGYYYYDVQYDLTNSVQCKYDGDTVYYLTEPGVY